MGTCRMGDPGTTGPAQKRISKKRISSPGDRPDRPVSPSGLAMAAATGVRENGGASPPTTRVAAAAAADTHGKAAAPKSALRPPAPVRPQGPPAFAWICDMLPSVAVSCLAYLDARELVMVGLVSQRMLDLSEVAARRLALRSQTRRGCSMGGLGDVFAKLPARSKWKYLACCSECVGYFAALACVQCPMSPEEVLAYLQTFRTPSARYALRATKSAHALQPTADTALVSSISLHSRCCRRLDGMALTRLPGVTFRRNWALLDSCTACSSQLCSISCPHVNVSPTVALQRLHTSAIF
eukprot:COSAG01_NODE_2064_length_8507_cov_312.247740_5_plen_297_part_00